MHYKPGTHIVATLETAEISLLETFEACKQEINRLVHLYQLHNLGEVYHNFSPAGFTAVVCLSESHLSLHTWPEYGRVNLDIYLSNHERSNDGTVHAIYTSFVQFFKACELQFQTLTR